VKLCERPAFILELPSCIGVVGRVGAATQRRFIQSSPREQAGHSFDVKGFTFVRCAYQRELALADSEMIGRSACDKWDGLKRLDSRARRSKEIAVAKVRRDSSVRLDGNNCTAMARFEYGASPDLDQYR
jgi:hypothetical protein